MCEHPGRLQMFAGEQEDKMWVSVGTPELKLWQALVECYLLQKGSRGKCVCLCTHTPLPQSDLPEKDPSTQAGRPQPHKAWFAAPCPALFSSQHRGRG